MYGVNSRQPITKKTFGDCLAKENNVRRCRSSQGLSGSSCTTRNLRSFSCESVFFEQAKVASELKSQQILVSSALRRPHASYYSLLDSQSLPNEAKPHRRAFRLKCASTVYSYAQRPVSACEISDNLVRHTKTSLLRSKSACEAKSTVKKRNEEKIKIHKKPCVVREECIFHKNALTPKEVYEYMNTVHAYLTGARYNRSRLVDANSLSKHGLYVSKDGLASLVMDKAKSVSPNTKPDIPEVALQLIEDQTSRAELTTKGTNTAPHYLSLNSWLNAEWNLPQSKKHLPARKHRHITPICTNKVKTFRTQYVDYDTM